MRASLARRETQPVAAAQPLLDPRGARVILGASIAPLKPSATTLFGPRGVCGAGGGLIACDTGHHRLMIWTRAPVADDTPADLVVGQPDFASEGRNGGGAVGLATLNVPTGIAARDGMVAVADAWNHRVLLWRRPIVRSNQPADIVLGQADFTSGDANRGAAAPRADTLHWPYGVAFHEDGLIIADTGNRRVLRWTHVPENSGAPADVVFGQKDFTTRDTVEDGLRWPHGVAIANGRVLVADAGAGRVVTWNGPAYTHGLSQPYAAASVDGRVIVADTANSRLLGYSHNAPTHLAGQTGLDRTGENRWGEVGRDTLSWPYGLAVLDRTLAIADTGNNRILLWDLA